MKHRDPPKRKDFLVYGRPVISDEEVDEVVECLKSGWIGTGPRVARFEQEFREYRNAPYSVAVNSCTAALHLSLLAAGLEPGDEVITTPMTFCATINAIIHADLKPVLVDINPSTLNIDHEQIRDAVTDRTRALLPVHFGGRPCAMDAICELAQQYDLRIIEDCAHATEAEFADKPVGTFGDFGCFSFYVTKSMTTGEGGMILTQSEGSQSLVKMLALHGMSRDAWHRFGDEGYRHYDIVGCGFKYNMTDMQAAMGSHQLRRVQSNWSRRKEIWHRYFEAFRELPIELPAQPDRNTKHSYHLFTILVDQVLCGTGREEFIKQMAMLNIGIGVHYLSIPEYAYYQRAFGWTPGDYPHAMKVGRQTVSLPMSAGLSDADVQGVIEAVKYVVGS